MEDRLFREIVHMTGHLVIYSLVLWQLVLGVWLILKWVNKNWKIKKTFSVMSPTENKQPIINIDGSSISEGVSKTKKDMGPIDVDVQKNIVVGDVDKSDLSKSTDVTKGKVKTQKDKLKALRK